MPDAVKRFSPPVAIITFALLIVLAMLIILYLAAPF